MFYEKRGTTAKFADFDNNHIVDDNLLRRLSEQWRKKDLVIQAEGVQKDCFSKNEKPGFAVVDLRLADEMG